jgi:3-phosphoshikimate 1-carboxyvinyltransferase
MNIRLHHPSGQLTGTVPLPSSKSESNRVLIMQALSQGRISVDNLSDAQDTRTLAALLHEDPDTMDVGHAGTAMRFLTAFLAFRPADKVLTGSHRMVERPIGALVTTLQEIGADIHYLGREGYPPLAIYGKNCHWGADAVEIRGDISSQFITALLMIAPTLPDGLRITITGPSRSWPYIRMTLDLMARFGVQHSQDGNTITVKRQLYQAAHYAVEGDWSAVSYWFVAAGLSQSADILVPGLFETSLQGDKAVLAMAAELGITATFTEAGLRIQRQPDFVLPASVDWDFNDCPDLAQGLMVLLGGLGVAGHFTGLESLRIKETDRIAAMQTELAKFGVTLSEGDGEWWLKGQIQPATATIDTYHDHRMAMAFAPLAIHVPGLEIADAAVVAKSYPRFWEAMRGLGFEMEELGG